MNTRNSLLIYFFVHLMVMDEYSLSETGNTTDDYTCLKGQIETDASRGCFDETVDILSKGFPGFLEAAAHRGAPDTNFRLSIRDLHLNMRMNYKELIEAVGKNIYPLIVATDSDTPELSGTGGAYKVYYRNGTMRRIVPVGPEFEIHKGLSHMVLGVYSIISPYFRSPNSINWQPKLREMDTKLRDAMFLLKDSGLSDKDKLHALEMMKIIGDYISVALKTNSVTFESYQKLGDQISPFIDESMKIAAKVHVEATVPALQQLKAEMGDEEWKKVYVIIPTVWPVSLYNLRLQVFRKVMDFEQVKQQVLIAEGAFDEDEARTTLGRIVGDRALAQLVFGGKNKGQDSMKDHVYSLSTQRDLVSSAEEAALDQWCSGRDPKTPPQPPRCPMSKLVSTMTK